MPPKLVHFLISACTNHLASFEGKPDRIGFNGLEEEEKNKTDAPTDGHFFFISPKSRGRTEPAIRLTSRPPDTVNQIAHDDVRPDQFCLSFFSLFFLLFSPSKTKVAGPQSPQSPQNHTGTISRPHFGCVITPHLVDRPLHHACQSPGYVVSHPVF